MDKEPLASFHKRTQECLETQRSIGQVNVPETEQAIDFLYNILQREYSGLNEKLVYAEEELKRAHATVTAAATLANPQSVPIPFITGYPFQRANSYQVTNATLQGDKHQKTQQTAFATTSSDQSQKAKPTRIADAVWAKMSKEQRTKHINDNARNRICKYCRKTGHADRNCDVLAASVKAIQLETDQKVVAMTWQDDYNDISLTDEDTETIYTLTSEPLIAHETALTSTHPHVSNTSVLCDHCASASIFHHAPLLTNIRTCVPVKFSGVGGEIIVS